MSNSSTTRAWLLRACLALICATTFALLVPLLVYVFDYINHHAVCGDGECKEGEADERIAAFTLWLAVFTAFLGFSTLGLYAATRKSIKDARQHAELELRAHVMLEKAQAIFVHGSGITLPVHLDVMIKNFGRTPAYKVKLVWKTEVLDWPVNKALPLAQTGTSNDMIGPDGVRQQRASDNLALKEFWEIENGSAEKPAAKAMFLYGRADYVDAFKQKRWMTFQLFMGGSMPLQFRREFLKNGTPQDLYAFNVHEHGNEAN